MTKVAILIDGGYLLKRLPAVRQDIDILNPGDVVRAISQLVRGHLEQLNRDYNVPNFFQLLSRAWHFYVGDMIEFGEKVLSYTEGMDQATFVADSLRYDATLRNLKLIGEVATHIPSDVHTAYPKIQWHRIMGTRNHLAQNYLKLNDDFIWTVIQNDVPKLLPALRKLLDTTSKDP